MATDPVKGIHEQRFDVPVEQDVAAVLTRLAALPPADDAPYLTFSLDWRPDGPNPGRRFGATFFEQNAEQFLADFAAHTPARQSLDRDIERLRAYLADQADAAVQGIAVVARSAGAVFEAVPLGVPLPNKIVTGPTPALRLLAAAAEDEPTFALLVADQREANLSIVTQAKRAMGVEVDSRDDSRNRQRGAFNQKRDQHRAEERVDAFAKGVAEETRRVLDEEQVDVLVLAGEEQITTAIEEALHQTIRDRVVGTLRADARAPVAEIVAEALPLVERAERDRELAAVEAVREGAGPGGKATTGAVETLTALQTGQVLALVMNDDFAAPGWADYSLPLYGVGPAPTEHPAGGDAASLVPVALEEELVRLAIQLGAEIEIVQSAVPVGTDEIADVPHAGGTVPRSTAATALDALGGVGATLRFTLEGETSTAAM